MFRKESISPTPQPTLDNVLTDFDFDSFLVDNDNGVQDFDFRSGFASSTVSEGGGSETKQDSVSGIALALRKVNAPTKKIEISYTISQNYTAGEEARRSILLAGFGTRGRPRRLQPQSRPRPQPISRSTPRPSGPGTKDAAATSGRPKEGEERKNRIARLLAAKTAKALAAPNPDPPSAPSNSDMVQVQGLGQGTASATLPKFKSWGENKQLIKQKLAALQKSTEAQAQKSATDTTDSDASQNGTPSSLMPSAMRPGYSQAGTTQLPRYPTYDESDQTPGKPTIYEPARESARRIRERRIRKRIWHSMSSSSPNMPRVGQNPPTSGETTSAEWSPLFPSDKDSPVLKPMPTATLGSVVGPRLLDEEGDSDPSLKARAKEALKRQNDAASLMARATETAKKGVNEYRFHSKARGSMRPQQFGIHDMDRPFPTRLVNPLTRIGSTDGVRNREGISKSVARGMFEQRQPGPGILGRAIQPLSAASRDVRELAL